MGQKQPLWVDAIDGAIAGVIATWLMNRVTTALYQREGKAAKQREDTARNGKTAYGVAAEKVAGLAGKQLSDDQRSRYGQSIHWALGGGAGALYGVLRPRVNAVSLGKGLLFGATFFLLMDEVATPALGLTPWAPAFPWQTHARGLAGHLTFGTTANATLAMIQPAK